MPCGSPAAEVIQRETCPWPRTGGASWSRPADGLRRRPDPDNHAAHDRIDNRRTDRDRTGGPTPGEDGDASGHRPTCGVAGQGGSHRRGVPRPREHHEAARAHGGAGRCASCAGGAALDAGRRERRRRGRWYDHELRRRDRDRERVHGPLRHAHGARVGTGRPGAGGDQRPVQPRLARPPGRGGGGAAAGHAVPRNRRDGRPRDAAGP